MSAIRSNDYISSCTLNPDSGTSQSLCLSILTTFINLMIITDCRSASKLFLVPVSCVCVRVCMCVCACMHVCVCMHACVCVCAYLLHFNKQFRVSDRCWGFLDDFLVPPLNRAISPKQRNGVAILICNYLDFYVPSTNQWKNTITQIYKYVNYFTWNHICIHTHTCTCVHTKNTKKN